MNKYCTFYIVRHGQTALNVEGKLQGHSDSPLTKKGIQESNETADLLKNITFDLIFSSDLLRAKRTAEIIKLDRELEVLTTKMLRERDFGPFEGELVTGEIVQKFDETLEKLEEAEKPFYKVHPLVESDNEIAIRLITFLRETAVRYPGKTILLVSHSGIIRAFLIKLGFGDSQSLPYGAIKNSAYVKVDCDGIDFFIKETHQIEQSN